jgi:DNA polymerase-3 subunit beta
LKFKSKTKELKDVILSVSRAVDIKPSTPSLQGIYIKVEGGSCEVVGSDLDLVIKARLDVESMVDGECLVSSKVLSEVVRKMAPGEVVFSDLGSEVMIETEKSEYKLRKLDHLTYPKALLENSYEEVNSQELEPTELFTALRKVGIAASPEGGKPILTGVYFDNTEEKTTLVSTDSYRLATNTISNLPIKDAGIVSYRSLNETIKLFEETENKIFINSTERELIFITRNITHLLENSKETTPNTKRFFQKKTFFQLK